MNKVAAILALCVAAAAATPLSPGLLFRKDVAPASTLGIVDPAYRCGGVGTPLQLRISECDGRCSFVPGRVYQCEEDFLPSSSAPSITLKVEVCLNAGFCLQILEAVLPNSSIQPGFIYTAKYDIVPNDQLSGQSVEFRAYLLHTDNLRLEICVSADIDVL